MTLQNIDITDAPFFGQTLKRKILAEEVEFTQLNFATKRLVMRVPVLHCIETLVTTYEGFIDENGEETTRSTTKTVLRPVEGGAFGGKNGRLIYQLPVDDNHLVDTRTGKYAIETSENKTFLQPEFSFIRSVIESKTLTLEGLIMQYLTRIGTEGKFDGNDYAVVL